MNHPLIQDLTELSDNDIENKINELSRKYFISKNPQVHSQITMILDMYKAELQTRIAKQKFQLSQDNDDLGLDNLINVS